MDDKTATELLRAQMKITEIQSKKVQAEADRDTSHRQYKIGLWALLIGIIVAVFLSAGVGIFLVLVGALTAVTQAGKKDNCEKIIADYELTLFSITTSIAQDGS